MVYDPSLELITKPAPKEVGNKGRWSQRWSEFSLPIAPNSQQLSSPTLFECTSIHRTGRNTTMRPYLSWASNLRGRHSNKHYISFEHIKDIYIYIYLTSWCLLNITDGIDQIIDHWFCVVAQGHEELMEAKKRSLLFTLSKPKNCAHRWRSTKAQSLRWKKSGDWMNILNMMTMIIIVVLIFCMIVVHHWALYFEWLYEDGSPSWRHRTYSPYLKMGG